MRKWSKRLFSLMLSAVMLCTTQAVTQDTYDKQLIYAAEEDGHWYTQKGWTYNGKSLTSLCYITSYAMILHSMGFDVDPVDVYVANGCSNYANHAKIANAYGVDATSETGSMSSMSTADKQAFIKKLIEKYPQGVIVGGNYGSGTHYIVAKKVKNDTIYFDDPAYATESAGCCISISGVYKLTWSNLTTYRVVKKKTEATATPKVTATPKATAKVTATPKPTTTAKVTATPKPTSTAKVTATPKPTTTAKVTATPKPTSTAKVTATPKPTSTAKVTATPKPASTAKVTATPKTTAVPSDDNVLGKYKVPTRTIYKKTPVMTGEDVKWVELALKTLGYSVSIDGKYTEKDCAQVKKYQKKKSLPADGYVGKKTRTKLISDVEIALTKVSKVAGLKLAQTGITALSTTGSENVYHATASWTKLKDVNGYVLVYSKKKTFTKPTKITTTKNKITIKKFKKGVKYYVKVRAYKKVNGQKVYGAYSAVKTLKN